MFKKLILISVMTSRFLFWKHEYTNGDKNCNFVDDFMGVQAFGGFPQHNRVFTCLCPCNYVIIEEFDQEKKTFSGSSGRLTLMGFSLTPFDWKIVSKEFLEDKTIDNGPESEDLWKNACKKDENGNFHLYVIPKDDYLNRRGKQTLILKIEKREHQKSKILRFKIPVSNESFNNDSTSNQIPGDKTSLESKKINGQKSYSEFKENLNPLNSQLTSPQTAKSDITSNRKQTNFRGISLSHQLPSKDKKRNPNDKESKIENDNMFFMQQSEVHGGLIPKELSNSSLKILPNQKFSPDIPKSNENFNHSCKKDLTINTDINYLALSEPDTPTFKKDTSETSQIPIEASRDTSNSKVDLTGSNISFNNSNNYFIPIEETSPMMLHSTSSELFEPFDQNKIFGTEEFGIEPPESPKFNSNKSIYFDDSILGNKSTESFFTNSEKGSPKTYKRENSSNYFKTMSFMKKNQVLL
jgi:hypothetical protein